MKLPLKSSLLTACILLGTVGSSLQAQSLTTTFASDNGGSTGWVVMFDATVLNPQGLRITALDVNCSSTTPVPITVDLWVTPNSYIGNERVSTAWIKVATGQGISAARNAPTYVDISDVQLSPGTYGLAVQVHGSGQAYTNGTGGNQNYADANLSLQLGAALSTEFLTTGSLFTPRVWNGTVYYSTPGRASYGVFGAGCLGSNGVPTLAPAPSSVPSIGQNLTLNLNSGPSNPTAATMALGFSKANYLSLPLPADLSVLGMTGCSLLISPLIYTGFPVLSGLGSYTLPIPNNPTLFGLALYHQAFVVDSAANRLGLTATNGGEGVIGN